MNSCLYRGWVRHRRYAPVRNDFLYSVFLLYLDLDELETVFEGRWLWSTRAPAPAWFRRKDHLGDPDVPLKESVRDLVQQQTGRRPGGPVRLLTHLRYFGYVINPVSVFYCYDRGGERVEAVVAEINNTPWGERHCYVLDDTRRQDRGGHHRFRFRKDFHVSPFMGMDQEYDWRFTAPGESLVVHMENLEHGARLLDSTLSVRRHPLTGGHLALALTRHPFMTLKVALAIYWQALKLRVKGAPFHAHPKHALDPEAG